MADAKGGNDRGIRIAIASYLYALTFLLVVVALQVWPRQALFAKQADDADRSANVLFFSIDLSDEARLICLVAIFGALGSLVHALRSFNWHVVQEKGWTTEWLLRYLLQPPTGAAIALVFYALVRAGFYTPEQPKSGSEPTNLTWVCAAVAVLVGMFKEQAAGKLKDIAEAMFKKPRDRGDAAAAAAATKKAGARKSR